MQTHLNKLLFIFFLLASSLAYSKGTITGDSDLLFTDSLIENEKIITFDEYSSDPRFYQLLSAENCDVLYNEIDFSRFNTQDLNVEYDNIIKSIILRPKEFKYNINFLEQSFKFQTKEMNTALFQFQSFDLNILKEMNEVKKNVEKKQLTGSESAIICEYNLLENIEIAKFPDLSINFENAQIIDTESISSKINVYFDGTVEYFFKNYTYQFDKSNFDLSRFPFDSHNIQTVIKLNMDDSAKISPSSYFIKKFKSLDSNNFEFINTPEFSIANVNINFGSVGGSQAIEMDFNASRVSYSFIFKFLLPLFIIIIISFLLYGFKRDIAVTNSLTLLLSMTVFSLVVNDSLPVTPYITFYDALYFISFISIGIFIFVKIYIFTLFQLNHLRLRIAFSHVCIYLIATLLCSILYFN
jgi:hypothetical protein